MSLKAPTLFPLEISTLNKSRHTRKIMSFYVKEFDQKFEILNST